MNATETDRTTCTGMLSFGLPAISVGTDLIFIADVRESLDTFGDRYLRRVYTAAEIDACREHLAHEGDYAMAVCLFVRSTPYDDTEPGGARA